jgi:hypothetical protein
MTPIVVRTHETAPQPWRNGGGVTRELLAWPSAADWRVRVSVADIASDGAFSSYPGVRRWFMVLKGAGVELRVDGLAHHLTRNDEPFAFDGAAPCHCRLIDGPTTDLNLMLRGASGTVHLAGDGVPWSPGATHCGLFTAVAGRCDDGTHAFDMPPYALAWFDPAPPVLCFTAAGRPAGATAWWLAATLEGDPA